MSLYRIGMSPEDSLPSIYDSHLSKHANGEIPTSFLKALIKRESDFNPTVNSKGLMQVTRGVRDDWNQAHPNDRVSSSQLLDPLTNIKLGVWYLRQILKWYRDSGVAELQPNFKSDNFVRLFVAGWNSGPFGIIRHSRHVRDSREQVTHAAVMADWRGHGGTKNKFLASSAKENWQRGVAALYRSIASDDAPSTPRDEPPLPDTFEPAEDGEPIEDGETTTIVIRDDERKGPGGAVIKYGFAALVVGGLGWILQHLFGR